MEPSDLWWLTLLVSAPAAYQIIRLIVGRGEWDRARRRLHDWRKELRDGE